MSYRESIETATKFRNKAWLDSPKIPSWVNTEDVGLDQFFTVPDVAEYCHKNMMTIMRADGADDTHYKFIEPSAGSGAFLDLLPKDRRIGLDIMPIREDVEQHDFLSWSIKPNCLSYATIGNPPFGYRAWLALAFMNHAATFSDYVGMILPMAFQSDGKGSPKHRVKGLELLHSETLPKDSFKDIYGKPVKINGLWQVWKRGVNNRPTNKKCSKWIDLFTVDQRKERLCGQERMHEADYFLQRTFYNEPPKLVKCFSKVRYVCGYGIVIKKSKRDIINLLNNTNWYNYSNLATHNCRHISMYHIERVLTDNGYIDD